MVLKKIYIYHVLNNVYYIILYYIILYYIISYYVIWYDIIYLLYYIIYNVYITIDVESNRKILSILLKTKKLSTMTAKHGIYNIVYII